MLRAILYFIEISQDLRIRPDPINVTRLADLLVRYGVRVAVINACRSAVSGGTASNLAQLLVDSGLHIAIDMQFNILSHSAETFVRTFYRELLLHGTPILEAVVIARRELRSNRLRATKFGHDGCLQDYMVPTVHVCTDIFPVLLKGLRSTSSQDRSIGPEKKHSTKTAPLIGREGNVLLLETIMAGLDRACINLIGQAGIGKTAFLSDVEE